MSEKKHFFGMIQPTREDFMIHSSEEDNKIMGEHFQYLKDLMENGKLVMAGPVLNDSKPFGILIFECDTIEEADTLFQADPSVKSGIQQIVKLEPFKLSLYRHK